MKREVIKISNRKSIGIDLDTTLNSLESTWLEHYNKDYIDNLTPKDLIKWDIENIVKTECGIKIFDYLHQPDFFYNLGIKPHAAETVEWLSNRYDIYIVTAYSPNVCVDKTKWVKEHLPFIDSKNIIFCNNKGTLNLDYLIDDGGHNIEAFKQCGIVFDMPYNRYLGDNYFRFTNWREILNFFIDEKI